jgi:hypothetical protein
VYIYEVDYTKNQEIDKEGNVTIDNLRLIEMAFTSDHGEMQDASKVVRNSQLCLESNLLFCTNEENKMVVLRHSGNVLGKSLPKLNKGVKNFTMDLTQFDHA